MSVLPQQRGPLAQPPPAPDPERRAFLLRLAQAAGGVALAGGAGALLARSPGWGGVPGAQGAARVLDFSHPTAGRRLGIGRGADRAASLDAALAAVGGLAAFVAPGDRVVLKVNAGFATAPELGATTHPELVAALVQRCLHAGATEVRVVDNPVADPVACFQVSGIAAAAEAAGARVILPSPEAFSLLSLPGGHLLRDWPVLTGPLAGATRLISVCPLKSHYLAGASMTLKNLYGLLGGARGVFHQDVHGTVAELARLVRPTLAVLDATWAMVRNGPTGGSLADLEERGAIAVGSDPLAVDAFGVGLLGLQPADLPYLVKAAAAGTGSTDWRALGRDPGGQG